MGNNCSDVDTQKFVITVPQISSFTASQTEALQANLAAAANVDPSRLNITQRPNDQNQNKDGDIIVSISKASDLQTEEEHSSIIYNLTQTFNSGNALKNFLSNSNINATSPTIKTLTFNETVGTTKGCYAPSPQGVSTLLFGSNVVCYTVTYNGTMKELISQDSNDNGGVNPLTPVIIGVVIGVAASIILVVALLMAIPGTRRAIFPSMKVRDKILRKTMTAMTAMEEENK